LVTKDKHVSRMNERTKICNEREAHKCPAYTRHAVYS